MLQLASCHQFCKSHHVWWSLWHKTAASLSESLGWRNSVTLCFLSAIIVIHTLPYKPDDGRWNISSLVSSQHTSKHTTTSRHSSISKWLPHDPTWRNVSISFQYNLYKCKNTDWELLIATCFILLQMIQEISTCPLVRIVTDSLIWHIDRVQ